MWVNLKWLLAVEGVDEKTEVLTLGEGQFCWELSGSYKLRFTEEEAEDQDNIIKLWWILCLWNQPNTLRIYFTGYKRNQIRGGGTNFHTYGNQREEENNFYKHGNSKFILCWWCRPLMYFTEYSTHMCLLDLTLEYRIKVKNKSTQH